MLPVSQSAARLIACEHCDLIHREALLPRWGKALCRRCGAALYEADVHSVDHALALALAGALLCVFANVFPVIRFNLQGFDTYTTIAGSALALINHDMLVLAAIVSWAALFAPALMLCGMLYVLLPLRLRRIPPGFSSAMRLIQALQPWVMIEVLMLGVLVSIVKLAKSGIVEATTGTWLCVGLMLVLAGLGVAFDVRMIWRAHDSLRQDAASRRQPDKMGGYATAADQCLAVCELCGLICKVGEQASCCPRCGTVTHLRRPKSFSRCLALLVASLILYLPANLLTIMETASPFDVRRDTIISGVVYLWKEGSPDLAVIVFVASVMVPLLKILALGVLLACVRWRLSIPKIQQAWLYRVIEMVGKWSMLDLFVIALLTSAVDFGNRAAVRPGPAALAFGAVVVLTMLAASAFDPRLIWDEAGREMKGKHD